MRRSSLLIALAFSAVVAPAAQAAARPPAPAPSPQVAAAPAPDAPAATSTAKRRRGPRHSAPRAGALSLRVKGAVPVGRHSYALTRQRLRVIGAMRPFARHQQVILHVFRGRRLVRAFRVVPHPSRTGRTGRFSVTLSSGRGGALTVSAVHRRSRKLDRIAARPVRVSVVGGNSGGIVSLAQARLAALGYAVPRSGVFDGGTSRALVAYRKVNGMARVPALSRGITVALIRGRGAFHARFPRHGKHIEADLGRQVLAELYGGRAHRIFTTSSGKPSTPTVLGSFRVYRKEPGTNSHGMVDSDYFTGGYAVHGYFDVPTYAASHGCLRVPIPNAAAIYAWTRIGDRVDVYP